MQQAGILGTIMLACVAITGLPAQMIERASSPSDGPAESFQHRAWHTQEGLPNNSVQDIRQTRDGFIWLATRAGLARFDGVRFVSFNPASAWGAAATDCRLLAEDRDGRLWVATAGGLLKWERGRFHRDPALQFAADEHVTALTTSREGGLWIGTDRGLVLWRGGEVRRLTTADGLFTNHITALCEDAAAVLWVGTWRGLQRLDARTLQLLPHHPAGHPSVVHDVESGPDGGLFVLSDDAVVHFRKDQRTIHSLPKLGIANRVTFLAVDTTGAVWLPDGGRVLRAEVRQTAHYDLTRQEGNKALRCACVDREGALWIGTESDGLHRLGPTHTIAWTTGQGLAHDDVWTVCQSADGAMWIGSDGGVSRFSDGKFRTFSQADGLSRNEVRALAETRDGTLWVGTLNGLDAIQDGRISHVRFPGEWFETKIRALLPARDGALWVGTVRGLARWENGQRTLYMNATTLGAEEVRALLEARDGRLWVGTLGGGLSSLSGGKLTTFTTTNGLSHNNVWALHEDTSGSLWIGTERGLNRWKDGRFTVLTTREGLPDDLVNALVEDDFGRLWVGHDRGIYWVARRELEDVAEGRARSVRAVRYDETDGLPASEINGQKSYPSACKSRDGRLWFPTPKGVVAINPASAALNAVPPPAAVELVRANGLAVFDNGSQDGETGGGPTDVQRAIRIKPAANHRLHLGAGRARVLEFRYTANTFVSPEQARFRYRLLGLDDHWIEAGLRREVHFTDLRPGDYQFEVVACNHHGVWGEVAAAFAFRIEPFFHQTWWFYAGSFVLVSGVVSGLVAWRIREVRRIHHLERINALNEQRTRIARDIHDEIGASLTQIVRLSESAERKPAGPGASSLPTRAIASVAEEAVHHLGEIVWVNNPRYDTLEDLVAYLREYAANYFAQSSIEVRFQFPATVDRRPVGGLFRRHLLLLLKEALQNVVKHAQASRVEIKLALAEGRLELRVRDNGRGWPPEVGSRFGNGLTNMQQRARELNGSLRVNSPPGGGTEICTVVPLPAE